LIAFLSFEICSTTLERFPLELTDCVTVETCQLDFCSLKSEAQSSLQGANVPPHFRREAIPQHPTLTRM
jgi:hypothetical protein